MKNKLLKSCLITSGIAILFSGNVMAGFYENDVTPPQGRLEITGATETDNVKYINTKEVEVVIYASDDRCQDNEIKYYISTNKISNSSKITDWKDYQTGLKVNMTLPNDGLNNIYAVFKDANGNTSIVYGGQNVEQTITYNVNASDASIATGLASKRTYGAPFVITNQVPSREEYYFKGWGLTATDTTPSFYAGDIIPADYDLGTSSNVNLYAIWTQDTTELQNLSDVVEIGDYVNYPVYYENVDSTGTGKSSLTGWRVISKDVDIDGNASVGTVNLVSAGVPLTYNNVNTSSTTSVENLCLNFLTTPINSSAALSYTANGFDSSKTLKEIFTNKYTATYASDTNVSYPIMNGTTSGTKTAGTLKVRAMTVKDITDVTGFTEIDTYNGTSVADSEYNQLYHVDAFYWLATACYDNNLYFVEGDNGKVVGGSGYGPIGIRTVVSLKTNVKTTGKDESGAWNIDL